MRRDCDGMGWIGELESGLEYRLGFVDLGMWTTNLDDIWEVRYILRC